MKFFLCLHNLSELEIYFLEFLGKLFLLLFQTIIYIFSF